MEKIILDIMGDDKTNAHPLSGIVSDLLMHKFPVIGRLVLLANKDNYSDFVVQLRRGMPELNDNEMLQSSFINLPITKYDFECFVKMLRRALFLMFSDGELASNNLCSAIAMRCYIDGYVFTTHENEKQVINSMISSIESNDRTIGAGFIILLSMYVSLYELHKKHSMKIDRLERDGVFDSLLKLQLDDNFIEDDLYDSIEAQSVINDKTSLTVQHQYEGNPYPVWQILDVREPESIASIMRTITLYDNESCVSFADPDILIAGCGTGSHALQTAMRIQHKSMTAIDLSRRSLAFAKRKAIEYGFDSIDFRQLDILNAADLEKKFDLIESVGVLHHMQTPLTGLKCLVDILRPGGLMNLGFYSKLGRRYIIEAKSIYDNPDRYVTDDEIRQLRIEIMNSDNSELVNNISGFKDFYSLHDCRDLIFHENENNYSIKELERLIRDAGLEFIGFDLYDQSVLSDFRQMFPDSNAQFVMKNWGVFEEKYPDTFASMYVFWCRKKT